MNHPRATLQLLAPILLLGTVRAQWATVVHGPTQQNLSVRLLDESNPTASGTITASGLEFVSIERTGRTVAQALQNAEPRIVESQGIQRLELPGAARLLHFRRNGGATWGFLHVRTDGSHAVVLEQPGVGANQQSPFADRLAIAADGSYAAVPGAAADLWMVRLDGQSFSSTGGPARQINVPPGIEFPGVMVTQGSVFFVDGNDRLHRIGRGDNTTPADVTPPGGAGAEVKDSLAVSGDQRTVAFLFGPRPNFRIYTIGDTGAATLLPPPPAKYEEPGYLPDEAGHPRLLLDHAATRLLYVDSTVRDEVYLLDLATGNSLHITQDLIFQPYIGVIILPSFVAGELVAAIGDPNQMDWFKVDGAFNVQNLTDTGSPVPPYPRGTLDPVATAARSGGFIASEQLAGGTQNLRFINSQTGGTTVLRSGISTGAQLGSTFSGLADLSLDTGAQSLLLDPNGSTLFPIPNGFYTSPTARDPSGQVRLTAVELGGGFRLPVFLFAGGGIATMPFEQGITQTVLTNGGGAFINGPTIRYVRPFVSAQRPAFDSVTVFLSGTGI